MKVKILFKTLCAMCVLALFSCNDASDEIFEQVDNEILPEAEEIASDDVTTNDVINVANSIFHKNATSRSSDYELSTVNDEMGETTFHIVNNGNNAGFAIISATKKFTPILAYSYDGNFNADEEKPEALKYWMKEAQEAIKIAKTLPEDSTISAKRKWDRYETKKAFQMKQSRALDDPIVQEACAIMRDSIDMWNRLGYQLFTLEDEDESWLFDLQNHMYYLYMDDYLDLAIGVIKYFDNSATINNYITSTWNQTGAYNSTFPLLSNGAHAYAGCGPVAVGQIMRYYQYPVSLDWANIPLNYGTTATSNLLLDIATRANANYGLNGTGTTLSNLKSALSYYGYSYTQRDHSFSSAASSVCDMKPVLMVGKNEDGEGHAWVASGYSWIYSIERTEIKAFTERNRMETYEIRDETTLANDVFLYMNWGWGGSQNGFYRDNLRTNTRYTRDRKDLINITPNNN